jgi:rhamnogalacturonan lyase-like protein
MHISTAMRALLVAAMSAALVTGSTTSPQAAGTSAAPSAERLDRGLISVHTGQGNFLSWRQLTGDAPGTAFNVYRDGTLVTATPVSLTNFQDRGAPANVPLGRGVAEHRLQPAAPRELRQPVTPDVRPAPTPVNHRTRSHP